MKILIFGMVAILCMQTNAKTCEDELASIDEDGTDYLNIFQSEHDVDNGYTQQIGDICNLLISFLQNYTAPDYGQGLTIKELKSSVNYFFDGFYPQYVDALNLFTELENGIADLVELTACIVAKYKLTCKDNSTLSGCKAELNNAKCVLVELTGQVPGAEKTALGYISYLINGAKILNKNTRDFSEKYYISCDSWGGDKLSLKAVQTFFDKFNKKHNDMHERFLDLQSLCELIVNTVQSVIDAFAAVVSESK